jgi:Flp pilus assembly protein TadD
MGWVLIALLAVGVFLTLWRFAALNQASLQLLAAALFIGIAGYAVQGHPLLYGKAVPRAPRQEQSSSASGEKGSQLSSLGTGASWLTIADSYQSSGDKQDVIRSIQTRLQAHPNDAELWVALGSVLVMHADGRITPAAELALGRAERLSPDHPGPKFFYGLLLAQNGKPEEAERIWTELLTNAPANAEWRPMVEANLAALARGRVATAEGVR